MKKLLLVSTLFLVACSTPVPVKQQFPQVAPALTEKCQALMQVQPNQSEITEFLKVVIQNYALYHQCSNKVDGWNEWYTKQKEIFDRANSK